jgi:demethylspheroidene O-methyltransferase
MNQSMLAADAVPASLLDRGRALRDRILASPGFRRWAAAFPATRPIARRRTQALFDLCAGFVYSQVLLACVQLRLFDILAEGPKTPAAIALRCGLSPAAAARLLDAAAGLRLVSRRSAGRYGLGGLGAALVDNPAVTEMVQHHAMLYADLRDPVALLRGEAGATAMAAYWPYAARRDVAGAEAAPYSALMAASQAMIAQEVLDAYDLRRHRCLLDVGGGTGAFIAAALIRAPALRAILFDLPAVAAQASQRFASEPRVQPVGGDFHADRLPTGADVVTLIRVIHDHDDDAALALLRSARQALPSGGTLLLAEPMADTPGAAAVGSYFAFYLLAMGSGRPRTQAELEGMLHAAGFAKTRLVRTSTPLLTQLLAAS